MAQVSLGEVEYLPKRPIKTALHQAILDHRLHQVRLIVTHYDDDVDTRDVFGRTPLMLASLLDNEDDGYRMAKILLSAGAFVSIKDAMGRSALHYACMRGKERLVRRFLKSENAEINAPDNDGNTPLIHAALSGNPDVVRVVVDCLLKFGMPIDSRNGAGYTALLAACKYGHYASAHVLLTDGQASPALRDNQFLKNALDWTNESTELRSAFEQNSVHRNREPAPRFARENSMYGAKNRSLCQHVKTPTHPLGVSLDSALRLPAIFNSFTATTPSEDGKAALLKEIQDLLDSPKYRPVTRSRARKPAKPAARPVTAQLDSITPACRAKQSPDLRTLLDLYSDQYPDRLWLKRTQGGGGRAAGGRVANKGAKRDASRKTAKRRSLSHPRK